jgi:transcriptional regulator with XRE-family HTH domain
MLIQEEQLTVTNTSSEELKVRYEWVLWLRRQIEKSNKSYRVLAEETGLSHNMISKLQKPEYLLKSQPSTETCNKLAAAFGADPDLLLYLAKHRDIDPRKLLKVRPEIAQLQRRILDIERIEDETELQKAIRQMNVFLDTLLSK